MNMRKVISLSLIATAALATSANAASSDNKIITYSISNVADVAFGSATVNFTFSTSDYATVGSNISVEKAVPDTLTVKTNKDGNVTFQVYTSATSTTPLIVLPAGLNSLIMDFGANGGSLNPFSSTAPSLAITNNTHKLINFTWKATADLKAPTASTSVIVKATLLAGSAN